MFVQNLLYCCDANHLQIICSADGGDLLLASCSQDSFIRTWRISCANKIQEYNTLNDELEELKLTSNVFSVTDKGTY